MAASALAKIGVCPREMPLPLIRSPTQAALRRRNNSNGGRRDLLCRLFSCGERTAGIVESCGAAISAFNQSGEVLSLSSEGREHDRAVRLDDIPDLGRVPCAEDANSL